MKELWNLVIKKNISNFELCSNDLKNNIQFVSKALDHAKEIFKFFGSEMKNNKTIVLKAISSENDNFNYASKELKNDKDFIYSIMDKYSFFTIEFVLDDLKNDINFILKAINNNPN